MRLRTGQTKLTRRGLLMAQNIVGAVLPQSAPPAPSDATTARNLATIRAGFDTWRAGTGTPLDLLADDVIWQVLGNSVAAGTYSGKPDLVDRLLGPFNARLSERLIPTVREIHADGNTVIAFFDGEGTALDGLLYRNTYGWLMHLREDQITNIQVLFDGIPLNDLWQRVKPG
jgi:uncharacterized protein